MPSGARDVLDIGGSHGYYSVALCRRHEGLRSVVLDLPEAVERAPLLAAEDMGDRVVHRAGNAVEADLGTEAYDLIFTANLVHHLSEEHNRDLATRAARALRPGGVFAILEPFRPGRRRTPASWEHCLSSLRADQPVRHLDGRGDGGLGDGGAVTAAADPVPHRSRRRHPGGHEAEVAAAYRASAADQNSATRSLNPAARGIAWP